MHGQQNIKAKTDVTKLSTQFNKHRVQITLKTPEIQLFLALQYACEAGLILGAQSLEDI